MDIRGGTNLSGVTIIDKYRVPSAPIIGIATKIDVTSASVSFTAPSYDGNQPITSYTAVSIPGNITGTISQSGSGTITVTGLSPGAAYSFVVYATNQIGNSVNSSASNQILTDGPPYAPTNVTATASAWSTVTVTFTAPVFDGGSTITSYTAVSTPEGKTGTITQSGSGSITVTGLTATTNYTFTVYATNALGNSIISSPSNSVPGGSGTSPAPLVVSAYPASQSSIGIDYTAPVGLATGNSVAFDGTASTRLTSNSTTTLGINTLPFTIELWFYAVAKTNSQPVLVSNGTFTTDRWAIYDRHSSYPGGLSVSIYNASTSPGLLVGTTPIENGKWYHVALVKNSSNYIRLYVNGKLDATWITIASLDGGGSERVYVASDGTNAATAFNGYISNLRIVKNIAVYTGQFTVPAISLPTTQSAGTNIAAITNTTSTVLLICKSSTIIDNSSYSIPITSSGNAVVSTKTPFITPGYTFTAVSSPGGFTKTVTGLSTGSLTVDGLSTGVAYTFTMYATTGGVNTLSSLPSSATTIATSNPGQVEYTTAGTYSWTVPAGVYSISVVCIGSGAAGGSGQPALYGLSGAGAQLSYRNDLVTVPGTTITIVVGATVSTSSLSSAIDGNPSYLKYQDVKAVNALGGGTYSVYSETGSQTSYAGGGAGGASSFGGQTITDGAGGAAGYSGNGGNGGNGTTPIQPTGGAGGGGGSSFVNSTYNLSGAGGGGVGIFGEGTSGVSGGNGVGGTGGSGGTAGGIGGTTSTGGAGGNYGGGGGAGAGGRGAIIGGGQGGRGAVRIIWPGNLRYFPSTRTSDE